MMKRTMGILFACLASASYAQTDDSARWVYAGVTKENGVWWLDAGRVTWQGSTATLWLRTSQTKTVRKLNPTRKDSLLYDQFMGQLAINCAAQEQSQIFSIYYRDGSVIRSGRDYGTFDPIVPGSMAEHISSIVCPLKPN